MATNVSVITIITAVLVLYATFSQGEKEYGKRVARQAADDKTRPEALEGEYCALPPPLVHGRISPSMRRCPDNISSAACQMIPGTHVPNLWLIYYSCNPGYELVDNKIRLSVCITGKWIPSIPVCVEMESLEKN